MAAVVTIYNEKGGVGKSTSTVMLADGLAYYHKYRVLVIDFDRQAGVSRMLIGDTGIDEVISKQKSLPHILHALPDSATCIKQYIYKKASDLKEISSPRRRHTIDLIASIGPLFKDLPLIERTLETKMGGRSLEDIIVQYFSYALDAINDEYDVIILDCPAYVTAYANAAIKLADCMIAPTELEHNSLAVLGGVLSSIEYEWKKDLETFVRVLVCKYDHSSSQQMYWERMKAGTYDYRVLNVPIAYSDSIKRAMKCPDNGQRKWKEKYGNSTDSVEALAGAVIGEFGRWISKKS